MARAPLSPRAGAILYRLRARARPPEKAPTPSSAAARGRGAGDRGSAAVESIIREPLRTTSRPPELARWRRALLLDRRRHLPGSGLASAQPFDTYDVQYLVGVKGAPEHPQPGPGLVRRLPARRRTRADPHPVVTAYKFRIIDSAGTIYYPTPLNSNVNQFAWTPQTLKQDEIEPVGGSVSPMARGGGGLILFKQNPSVYSNRPLTLVISTRQRGRRSSRLNLWSKLAPCRTRRAISGSAVKMM